MKKLIVGRKWKKYLASRSRSQLKANARFSSHRRKVGAQSIGRPRVKRAKNTIRVVGPEVFSLVRNASEMNRFFARMRTAAKKNNVFVELKEVKTMTPDAIAGLLATIHRIGASRISGNVPTDANCERMLNDSGFRAYVRNSRDFQQVTQMGQIVRRTVSGEVVQNKFDQFLAQKLIEFAMLKLNGPGRSHGPSYSILCEAMLNTLTHAREPNQQRERWWASIYFDAARNRACFTMLDLGLGIFGSHTFSTRLNIQKFLRLRDHAEILEMLYQGKIPSSTKVPGRGNGIPGMYDHCKAGRIKDLVIISNNTIGNAETDTYEVLSDPFDGTLIYWEI